MPLIRSILNKIFGALGRYVKYALKVRSVLAFCLLSLALGSVWIASISSQSYNNFANLNSVSPPDLTGIEDRGLNVVTAFMDRNGSIVVREFGKLRDDGVAPEDTLVDLGSITKTVTAVAILKLVEQGKLDLNETIDRVWPDVSENKEDITVHELLTHTSGLTNEVGHDNERVSRETFVDRVFETDHDEDDTGEYKYSNTGYGLLAAIVERRSGKTFDAFLQEDLLKPAGLDPIGYELAYSDDRSLRTDRAWRTTFQRQSIRAASWGGGAPGWNLIGNGGLVSTPVSFLRFWSAVRQGRVISKPLLQLALTPHVDGRRDEKSFYGYGLMMQDMPPHGRVYWHDGENDHFSSEWRELGTSGLIVFTAGRDKDAFEAMRIILRELGERAVGS
jgi:CubicO group peptidase (beta-lactamase class C family)